METAAKFGEQLNHWNKEIEIVSVDVICEDIQQSIVLAISYLKLGAEFEEKCSAYMNIYHLPVKEPDIPYPSIMDAIAQSQIQYLNLDFIPFKLKHHQIYRQDGEWETCLLLSGNDNKIHVYRQSKDGVFFYAGLDGGEQYFPEFTSIEGCVTQMEFYQTDETHRLTAIGVQSGLVTVSLVNVVTREVEQTWTTELDSIITSLHFFTQRVCVPQPKFLDTLGETCDHMMESVQPINVLVTSAIDPAVVFCDVINCGLSQSHSLPHSNSQDVILCSCVMDIDFDGDNEILIGTYGQVLLAYKFIQERPRSVMMTSTPFQSPLPVPISDTSMRASGEEKPNPDQSERDKVDNRRRHRSVAAALESSGHFDRHDIHDRQQTDEFFQLEGNLKDGQLSRLVRSQENLAVHSPRSVCFYTPDPQAFSELSLPPENLMDLSDYPCYRLTWTKRFADPIMGVSCENVVGDGMATLVVLTLKGLHILQPDMNEVATLVIERLRHISLAEKEADEH